MSSNRITDMPGMHYLWKYENLYLAGQPAPETLNALKEAGVKKVFNTRAEGEMDFSWEEQGLKDLGIDYEQFPIVTEVGLDAKNCKHLSEQLNETDTFFIHCGSANRVGGWLITYLVQYKGIEFDKAVEIAMESGLSNPGLINMAASIVEE